MNCSKCLYQTVWKGNSWLWVQLPKGQDNFLSWNGFRQLWCTNLGFPFGVLDAIYYFRNLFGNFPRTLPWSLQLRTFAFPALRIVQPHLLYFMRLSSRWALQAVSAPCLCFTAASIPVVQLLHMQQGLLHSQMTSCYWVMQRQHIRC